jgi:hypothetical protein
VKQEYHTEVYVPFAERELKGNYAECASLVTGGAEVGQQKRSRGSDELPAHRREDSIQWQGRRRAVQDLDWDFECEDLPKARSVGFVLARMQKSGEWENLTDDENGINFTLSDRPDALRQILKYLVERAKFFVAAHGSARIQGSGLKAILEEMNPECAFS